ncbi:thioredoxin-like protein [Lipomyces kononenkoae]|uniref:Thioredoxin-like protein n=1 Tax=Lipomyces kononenkoae TaxID=34357 RepID=A0ACC3TB82_LIPKO
MQVEVDPNEDTEWNDILRAHGIIPERPPSPSQVIDEAIERAREHQELHRLSDKSDSELSALQDEANDSSEDEFIAAYRRKRLQELSQLQVQQQKFGRVFPVSKPEYQKEVTDASNECFVLVHLSLQHNLQSKLLGGLFIRAAEKFGDVKFVDITGARAIEGYPDRNCPTLLVYKDTDVKKQYVTLRLIGGDSMRMEDLEKVLVDVGAVNENDSRLISNKRRKNRDEEDNYDSDDETDRRKSNYADDDDDFDD